MLIVVVISDGMGKTSHASVLLWKTVLSGREVSTVMDEFAAFRAVMALSGTSDQAPSKVYPVPLNAQTASPAFSEV